ncbi:hypothetical protein B0A48_10600 [Cryoendolithus antarcticus]|uniref:3,4-dihydroxy-2-butanone-4-phosphate synthase n=1 Tax=Cryoendolithus antarcticus TaxID=1507870 RepID=A0A1V8SYA7_9PEZI|nr:hypothetical protein B0A48_10600 [Cryoendolithus antarcticus]
MAQPNGVPHFDTIDDAIDSFAAGKFIIVLDNEDRENEGDLIIAASALTPAKAAFLVRHTSGYVCAPLTPARAAELELPQMVTSNEDPNRTAYTITVDAAEGVTTGISAQDRSLTWHVVPLQAREGGVRVRAGHTEAAVEFCQLAGMEPVGVIAELVEEGEVLEGKEGNTISRKNTN